MAAQRFLVKMAPPAGAASTALAGAGAGFRIRPLFASIGPAPTLAASATATWHLVEPMLALDAQNPWDTCHDMVTQGLGIAGAAVPEFAEPDFQQQWLCASPEARLEALTAPCRAAPQNTGPAGFPGDSDPLWYQDESHSQLGSALLEIGLPAAAESVRIAHLDTGFDAHHRSLPARLEPSLQRNFVDADRPADAADESSGLFNNRGHGTGTLGLLAGSPCSGLPRLGAAPFANIVPIRVANRVELFYNSAVAQAFDHVHALCRSTATEVQVVSMSLGGLASRAWADAVNALYDEGVLVVAAAGNNFGNLPTRNIVYPARFDRVVAACGVMADHSAYSDLPASKMAGNHGPPSKSRTALSAATPNLPWARLGCADVVDLDGAGTSAATPQVAAAAAIWLQRHRAACAGYSKKWMRVEAVRHALFGSADASRPDRLGRGELRAASALGVAPPAESELVPEARDSASFPIFRVLTGLGIEALSPPQQQMLELEALQLSQSAPVEALLPDPQVDPSTLTLGARVAIARALAAHPRASQTLKRALQMPAAPPPAAAPGNLSRMAALHLSHALAPQLPEPPCRRLRVYAYDPSLARDLESVALNETVLEVRWEKGLQPGPIGEYLEVIDIDPMSGCCYAPVDLDDARLLAADGLRPSEANPQFHQQMVYAAAMTTIDHFEKALGRVALWTSRVVEAAPEAGGDGATPADPAPAAGGAEQYMQRLRIHPHAMRAANAYYSPDRKALLLGYSVAPPAGPGAPRENVFTALSHDIVAHETTHALLDGLHRRYQEATNPDVLAFHEAFADIVALFQHFTMRESLRAQIVKSKGDLTQETLLAKLAVQFGNATGHYGGLRSAIATQGDLRPDGSSVWTRVAPSKADYESSTEPHRRGSFLVASVFDAFLAIYARRALDPIRLATNGSEVLPAGALPAEVADALTGVASKVAGHVLAMCIRALDYCPPVDITFGDFLRALVTADRDLIPNDPTGYRVAFVSAFAARGIYPENVRSLSVDTITWEPPPLPFGFVPKLLLRMNLQWGLQSDRLQAWQSSLDNARLLRDSLADPAQVSDDELDVLGLVRAPVPGRRIASADGGSVVGDLQPIEVHSVRPLRRVGPDGQLLSQLVVELTQSLQVTDGSLDVLRGGATLLIDLREGQVTYLVRKRLDQASRVLRQQALWAVQRDGQVNHYSGAQGAAREPFAALHRPV